MDCLLQLFQVGHSGFRTVRSPRRSLTGDAFLSPLQNVRNTAFAANSTYTPSNYCSETQ